MLIWTQVFKQLVRLLLQGRALSVEDVAEVLSLKDNDTHIADYATALQLLSRADVSGKILMSDYQLTLQSICLPRGECLRLRASGAEYTFMTSMWYKHAIQRVSQLTCSLPSWDNLRLTDNVTDAELNSRFRRTALYVALRATMSRPHLAEGYILSSYGASEAPSAADIALRWPGLSPDEVEALVGDYRWECKRLEELKLDGMYESILQLVKDDEGWTAM